MKAISKQDVNTLSLLVEYGMNPTFGETSEGLCFYIWLSGNFLVLVENINASSSFTKIVIDTLVNNTPEEGTPNEEMTDNGKAMVQLLFEIEKAIK